MTSILIKVPNWLGDAVMSSYAIEAIKELYNNPKITLLGRAHILEYFKLDSYNYEFIEDSTKTSKSRIVATIQLGKKLEAYDIAFSFTNSFLSALLLYLSGSKKRVGFTRELRGALLTHKLQKSSSHQAYEYLRLASFEQEGVLTKKSLNFTPTTKDKNTIIIAPGAAYGSAKRWGEDRFAELITQKQELYFKLVGAKSDSDICKNIENICLKHGASNFINLCGKTSLKELAENIKKANIVISNDSGVMHLAAALKTKVVAIFGPTDETRTSIWDETENIIIKKETSCAPCKHRICPKESHLCMEKILPKDVILAIESLGDL
ncbi:MAG: lipopolysaccharide heptosyltransferase II [Campylobacterales bacterium]